MIFMMLNIMSSGFYCVMCQIKRLTSHSGIITYCCFSVVNYLLTLPVVELNVSE